MTQLTRIMCVGQGRITETMVTLSFDNNLVTKPTQTYIISPYSYEVMRPAFTKFNIDTDTITVLSDQYFEQYYKLGEWAKSNWYKQQAFKLCALDHFDSEYFLIQDCDIALIKPYNILVDGKLNFKAEELWNPHQHLYGDMISEILGIPRTLPVSLVNEILPYTKEDWQFLKRVLEKQYKTDFLSAIASVKPFDDTKWFSEYELLGMFKMFKDDDSWAHYITASQPPIDTWDDFYNTDWSKQDTCKFHAPPLKFMSVEEGLKVVEHLKNVN